ncbi:hypothetical protein [Salinisphaera orenii]|uniref:HTH Mu-type domain-containing protein n=1 Tax=Salinisphaera orenii YIM 95161 TaxID=1051139 RepID=A0A423PRS8_9GAMM|nr:hypothetical protein [Salinisphaera halophila]ROO28262.1 hypothetical protein SAHL_10655 [Salinisphaera halophila YIM 95161]
MSDVTIRQIADALGRDRSAISRRAKKEGWPYIEEKARGGARREYVFAQLPPSIQKALHGDVVASLVAESDALVADLVQVRQRIAALDAEIAAMLKLRGGDQ